MRRHPGRYRIGLVASGLLSLLVCPCRPQDRENLVANPGFEQGVAGWEIVNPVGGAATVAPATGTRSSGRGSVHAANTDAADLRPVGVRQSVAIQGGRTYRLTVQSRNTALQSSGGVRLSVFAADGRKLSETWVVQLHMWEGDWALSERTVSVPPQAVRAELLLSVNGLGQVWFDDVSLVEQAATANPAEQVVEQIPAGISVTRYEAPAPVMTVAASDIDGDGRDEVVIGDIEHGLTLMENGKAVWRVDVGGLPCHIACGDADDDGREEIAVATMDVDGNTVVLSSSGKRIWSHSVDDNRCSRVAWADLEGDGKKELLIGSGPILNAFNSEFRALWNVDVGGPRLAALTAADIDSDGRDEVLAGYEAQRFRVLAVDADGTTLWRYVPANWPGSIKVSSLFVPDVADGPVRIVGAGSSGAAFVLHGDGTEMWRRTATRWPRETYLAEPITYTGEHGGPQILLMGRRSISIRSLGGPEVFTCPSGVTIIDSARSATEPNVVYLASSGLRDPSYYRLEFSEGGRNDLASYDVPDPIGPNLDGIYKAVLNREPLPVPSQAREGRRFHVLLYRNSREQVEATWPVLKSRNTLSTEYEILSYVKELPVELHRFPMTTLPEILEYVQFFEEEQIPFYLFVDHGCRPWISLDTARKIVDAAPTWFRGFYVAEANYNYPGDLFEEWLAWAGELLDTCHERGKKVIFKEMYDCWSLLASDPAVFKALFKYPETIVPMFATNNAHAPEIQIGGMLGLRRWGLCRDWGMSSQHWNWSWNCIQRLDYEDICPPDVILRMDLAAASLGCTYFHVEGGQRWIDNEGNVLPESTRHRELLYQLMERNVIVPHPWLLGLSPVAIVRTMDPQAAGGARIGHPASRRGTRFREGLLGVRASMQTTPPYYLPAYAYGLRHYFDGLFPATPYGYLPIAPGSAGVVSPPQPPRPGVEPRDWRQYSVPERNLPGQTVHFIHTDTRPATLGEITMSAEDARPEIVAMLESAAGRLPFRTQNAFLSVHRVGDDHRLILIDPGYLNPVGVRARVRTRIPDFYLLFDRPRPRPVVVDLLTGERLPVQGDTLDVDIPAGAFRLLEVRMTD